MLINALREDPLVIFEDIRPGFARADAATFISGRGEAIARTIASAGADDVILVAGKGHEDYQEIKGVKHHFDDCEVLRDIFAQA